MSRLIVNMVGRNEADRYLVDVLIHARKIADLVVFTDDCSIDSTAYVAENFGAKVSVTEEPLFTKDESQLRSLAWEHLSEYAKPGDWILALDCDEKLYGYQNLPLLLDQSRFDVLGVTFYHMWNYTHYRVDKAWAPVVSSRLFRYFRGGEFLKRKLACGSEPTYVQELIRQRRAFWDTGLSMKHLGYVRDDDKIAKHQRYMELDGGDFHSRQHLDSILDTNPSLVEWRF